MQRTVILISNRVMHYRVSVYNYFHKRFLEDGYRFILRTNRVQRQNQNAVQFAYKEMPFSFHAYKQEIEALRPDAVIIFLHLKDRILWPLIHWLKWKGIPCAFWTKGANLDDAKNAFRHLFFRYLHTISDGLILYSENEIKYVSNRNRYKIHVANNTINFHDFPKIDDSKENIRNELNNT